MKRSKKQEVIEILKKDFTEYDAAVMVDYRGLNVAQISDLRNKLREQTCSLKVVKNTFSAIASEGTQFEALKDKFQGPTAFAFTKGNPVQMAKILTEYSKQNENLKLKLGFLRGKLLTSDELKEVAKLPPKEVLLARLIGAIQSPVSGLLSVIQGPARSLVCAINAVAEKRKDNGNTN